MLITKELAKQDMDILQKRALCLTLGKNGIWQMSRFSSKLEGPTFYQSTLAQASDTSLYTN